MDAKFIFAFFLISSVCSLAKATCPHLDPTLLKWSNDTTWGADFRIPREGKWVIVDQPILLDTSPPPLTSLLIAKGGKLVWSDDDDIELIVGSIKLEGELIIGSPTCKFEHKATITLIGKSDDEDMEEDCRFGRKFLGVARGGTLRLHGKDKLSWTKLNQTAEHVTFDNGLLYDFSATEDSDTRLKGLYAAAWYPNGSLYAFEIFRTTEDRFIERDTENYIEFIDSVPEGYVVAVVDRREFTKVPGYDYEPIYAATEDLAALPRGTSKLRSTRGYDAYALLAVKGQNEYTVETRDVDDGSKSQTIAGFISRTVNGAVYTIRSVLDTSGGNDEGVEFYVVNKDTAFPKLSTIDDVTSWNAGDTVVIASTDYDMEQAEEKTIYPCFDCLPNEFRVDCPPKYTHYGEMTEGIDERGEVALLTRNILIQGQMENKCYGNNKCDLLNEDTFGGHLLVSEEYEEVYIEGVEFKNMGQQATEGRNPVHFAMLGDVGCKAFFKGNSIHHSYSRCVNIRGTFGLLVEDNVGYDIMGHCYFLSDGVETDNVFDGNIGMNIKYSTLLPTERSCEWHRALFPKDGQGEQPGCGESEGVSAFWIAHPKNVVRNNVAAGSVDAGFWFPLFEEATGDSAAKFPFPIKTPLHTPILEFTNNAAHSGKIGLIMDRRIKTTEPSSDKPQAYLAFLSDNEYSPWAVPDDPTSGRATSYFRKLTAYKNSEVNAFARGGDITFAFSSFGDSPAGLEFAASDSGLRQSSDNLFIGQSKNSGKPCTYSNGEGSVTFNRSLPQCDKTPDIPFYGFVVKDGPNLINHCLFKGYANEAWTAGSESGLIPAGGIGFITENTEPPKVTMVTGLHYDFDDEIGGNRVFNGDESLSGFTNYGGDQLASFYDVDGCTTGYSDTTVVKDVPFLTSPLCYFHDTWQMSVCPYHYSRVSVNIEGREDVIMVRDDAYDQQFSLNEVTWNEFLLMNDKSYTMHFNVQPPSTVQLSFSFLYGHAGDFVRLGVCFQKDVESFEFNDGRTAVGSIEEIDADDNGNTYFWDSSTGLLFFKVVSKFDPEGKLFECTSEQQCPTIRITPDGGSRGVPECYTDAYGPYRKEPDTENSKRDATTQRVGPIIDQEDHSATSTVIGAGVSRPFNNRRILIVGEGSADPNYVVNGNWGAWTSWSECSNTCDGIRQRRRSCDDPPPENGGLLCSGQGNEMEQCIGVVGCPVDGNWGEWTPWSNCSAECDGGMQNRTRLCDNPPAVYGGAPCDGADAESEPCNTDPCPTTDAPVDEIVVAAHLNYSHVGCFIDERGRDLSSMEVDDRYTMRADFCVGHCVHYGYFFAAIQNGRYCRCGHTYGRYGKADSSECDKPCPGDESVTCGGSNRNDIYYTGIELPERRPCLDGRGVLLANRCFVYESAALKWYEAAQDCVIAGGHLANIIGPGQQAFLEYHMMTFGHGDYWIGLNDIEYEGNFEFTDLTGTELGHWNNFQEGYPAGNAETDDCVEIRSEFAYEWIDANCGSANMYICETRTPGENSCGNRNEGFSNYGSCYLRLEDVGKWDDAVCECAIRGGVPATIADSRTQLFISRYAALSATDEDFYFGLNDLSEEGNYTFLDGTPMDAFEAFCHDEPSNLEDEDCSMLVFKKNYYWEDVSCTTQGGVICELGHERDTPCPLGWTEFNGMCFLYVDSPKTYADATAYCQIMEGAALMAVTTNGESEFIYNDFALKYDTNLWLGLDDISEEGNFIWQMEDEDQGSLMNWSRNEPSPEEGDDCAQLLKNNGQWKAINCENTSRFVCEVGF